MSSAPLDTARQHFKQRTVILPLIAAMPVALSVVLVRQWLGGQMFPGT